MQDIEVSDGGSWWYAHGEQQHGPVSGRELKQLAATGKLQGDALLWRDGLPDWIEAAGVRGLPSPSATLPAASAAAATESAGLPGTPWFAVSTAKLLTMSLCTLGLYQVYWFYQHWRRVKLREHSDIMPVWRALFAPLFAYYLFQRMDQQRKTEGLQGSLDIGPLAAAYFLLSATWRLPDPWALLSTLAIVPLLPAQILASRLNALAAPEHDRNAGYSRSNLVAIVLGGLVLLMAVIGSFLPEPGEAPQEPRRKRGRSAPVALLSEPAMAIYSTPASRASGLPGHPEPPFIFNFTS